MLYLVKWVGAVGSPSTHFPATLAEEVLTLGVDLDEAEGVVSATDEETVIVGIIPPVTTQDE